MAIDHLTRSLFGSLNISASGLYAQRTRINTISENIANAETTDNGKGQAYRRKLTQLEAGMPGKKFSEIFYQNKIEMEQMNSSHKPSKPFKAIQREKIWGVNVKGTVTDPSPFKMVYDPHHPDANGEGYVEKPNVNIVQEMTELIAATRNFEANATAFSSTKEMLKKAIRL